jgi:hypothetical protein
MTIRALVTGTLHDAPQSRTSKQGNAYAKGKLRMEENGATVWCSLLAFGDAAELLLGLEAGASLSASGTASMSVWRDKQGAAQVWLSLKADGILPLKPKRRPKRAPRTKPPPTASALGEPFDDLAEWLAV